MSNTTIAQSKAISHTGSDILISAGAGSGKTFTLTKRIIEKLLLGDDITKKLIVTFTKEAANKLKSDITDAIAKKLQECNNEKDKELLREQIVKTSTADISTIHSFCLNVIRPNFNKLPLDSDFRIGEENEIDYIKKEVMKEVVEELYEAKAPSDEFLIVCDCYSKISENDALDTKLLTLYEKLASTPKFLDTLLISQESNVDFMQTVYGEVIIKEISMLISHYKPIYESIRNEIVDKDGAPKFLDAFVGDINQMNELEKATQGATYLGLKRVFEDYTPFPITGIKKSSIADPTLAQSIRDRFKKCHNKLKDDFFSYTKTTLDLVFKYNNKICKAIYNILIVFEQRFKERKRKYGICDFNDLERYTHQLLVNSDGTPTPLAQEISLKYNEIYIDEYQDTNALQDEIFASISRNNRFMVGDIKQSIYRFRSAEPQIFSGYRNRFEDITNKDDVGENGKTIFMSENFRCDESVINTSNDVSNYIFFNSFGIPYEMQDNLVWKKKYDASKPHNPQNSEICLLDCSILEEDDSDKLTEQRNILQAKYVAKRIYDLLENGTLPDNTPIKPHHIAILLRKGKYKKYYIDALSNLGIDTEYIDDVKFFEKPHVLLLLSILNIIDNPYRDSYLAGALCSPVFNFTTDELLKIRKFSGSEVPLYTALANYKDDSKIVYKIKKFIEKLLVMQNDIKKLSSYEAVSYVMSSCGLVNSSRSEKRDLIKLYNHAREYENGSYKGLYKFLNYIEGIKSSKSKETVFTNPNDCVRIMTIHASKGLEFEYCFLCNAEGEFYFNEKRDDLLFDKKLGIIGYVGNTGSLVKYKTILRKIATTAIDRAGKEEEMRILYVAMTRAKSKLIVTASVKDLEKLKLETSTYAPFSSPLYVYSLESYLDYIYNALYLPRSYVDFPSIDINELISSDKDKVESERVLNEELTKKIQDTLKRRFDFKYKYDYLNKIPSKLNVSKLKPNMLDRDENEEIDLTKELLKKPKFISGEKDAITGADKGTATHVFMQFCDFENLEKNGFEDELKNLQDDAFITENDAKIINKAHIEAFVKSALFGEMKNAKMMKREFRFNAMIPADEFTENDELKKQNVLVQGVVDAVFVNEGDELVLVDYKTDKVTIDNYKELLKERYTTQLSYYKKAIEIIFERPVDKLLIYSVPLAKEVEIK